MFVERSGPILLCTKCVGEGLYRPIVGEPVDFKKMINSKPFSNPLERRVLEASISKRNLVVNPCHGTSQSTEKKVGKHKTSYIETFVDGQPNGRFFAREVGGGYFPTLNGSMMRQLSKQIKVIGSVIIGFEAMLPTGLTGRVSRLEGWTGEGEYISLIGFSLFGKGANAQETHELRLEGMKAFLDNWSLNFFKTMDKTAPDFDNDGVKIWDPPDVQFLETTNSITTLMEGFMDSIWRHPDFTIVAPQQKRPYITPWAVGVRQRARDLFVSNN